MSFLGVSPPISTASPTLKEVQCNDELGTFLTLHRIAESDAGNRKREAAFEYLQDIFREWVIEVGLKREIADANCVDGAGARLFVFGSQRLGVHAPDADIDILCCAPNFVSRYDFFLTFLAKLKAIDKVSCVLSLPDAFTPVIKFSLNGLSIDLVFVSLAMVKIPENIDILDNKNLQKLDEASIRSLNGVRVTEKILKLVPNQETFSVALRAIKCWATRRGIYANVLGFLGGVNYAILVAFVCQRYTQACPSTIIHQFFKIFAQWHWPSPIVLTNVSDIEDVDQHDMIRMPSWNPKLYPNDGYHLMPIITPAFPSMNSAFNVGIPQFRMIQLEIQRGLYLFDTMEIMSPSGNCEHADLGTGDEGPVADAKPISAGSPCSNSSMPHSILWNTLFASAATDFFQAFPRYIQINVIAATADEHRLWFGWCESRLRQLFVSIDQSQMVFSHPYANCFHRRVPNEQGEDYFFSSFFVGLSFPERTASLNLTEIVHTFRYRVCAWVNKTATMDLKLLPLQGDELPEFVFSEISLPSNSIGCTPCKPLRPPEVGMETLSSNALMSPTMDCESTTTSSRGIVQCGSTPTLALLALDSVKKTEQSSVADHGEKESSCGDECARIEKQLFSDSGGRSMSMDSTCSSQMSGLNVVVGSQSERGKGHPPCTDLPSSSSTRHSFPPPPGLVNRSPLKTTRKEYVDLTAATDDMFDASSSVDVEVEVVVVVSDDEDMDLEEDGAGTLPCFSSPLKRIRPN